MSDLDTTSKRRSGVTLLRPSVVAPPAPDGTLSQGDQQHIAGSYSGIAAVSAGTTSRRRSALGLLRPYLLAPPAPDGTIGQGDRQHIAGTYSGISAGASTGNLNTRSKRASSLGVLRPYLLALVLPDGSIVQADRQHTAWTYSGIAATAGGGSSPPPPPPADSTSKRRSAIQAFLPYVMAPPKPDGALTLGDWRHLAMVYSDIAPLGGATTPRPNRISIRLGLGL